MEEGEVSNRSQARRTSLVLAAYLVLFLAAFIGLAPLFQIVAPLHAAALDARGKTEILSRAMVWGAITAAVANIAMGAISDRTRSRFGRRRPWIALGAVLTVLSYVGIWRSSTPGEFVWALVGFQLAFNVLMAPLSAVFADRVPILLKYGLGDAGTVVSARCGFGLQSDGAWSAARTRQISASGGYSYRCGRFLPHSFR